MCRTFWDSWEDLQLLMFSYMLWWPHEDIENELIFIFDEEESRDRRLAAVLKATWRSLVTNVYLEKMPDPSTFSANQRNVGYSRTMWSNFYSDLYSNAEYVAIIDSDIQFMRRPNPEDLFHPVTLKPIIRCAAQRTPHCLNAGSFLGVTCPADCMMAFPFMVKRSHFPLMREFITSKCTSCNSFEEAWAEYQMLYPNDWGLFVLMGTFLFNFQHDEYDFRFERLYPSSSQLNILDDYVDKYRVPTPCLTKHLPLDNSQSIIALHYQQLCVTSAYLAVDCDQHETNEVMRDYGLFNLWTPLTPSEEKVSNFQPNNEVNYDGTLWTNLVDTPNKTLGFREFSDVVITLNLQYYGGEQAFTATHYRLEDQTKSPAFSN